MPPMAPTSHISCREHGSPNAVSLLSGLSSTNTIMPNWVTWTNFWKLLAVLPGWVAFCLTVRKAWFERTLLVFTLRATNVEADEDDQTNRFFDGTGVVRALCIDVTNNGLRPVNKSTYICRPAGRLESNAHSPPLPNCTATLVACGLFTDT